MLETLNCYQQKMRLEDYTKEELIEYCLNLLSDGTATSAQFKKSLDRISFVLDRDGKEAAESLIETLYKRYF